MAMETKAPKPTKRKRLAPLWWRRYGWPVARHLIVPAVCVLVLFIGMTAGYVFLGKQPFSEVWKLETWKHMFDLIFAEL